jgi:small subunit ribosomal protein S5
MLRLRQQTGLTEQEISRIRIKNLVSHRVVNQTRMGKIQSLYFLTIAGNQDGMLGIGEGKAAEDEDGKRQAMMNAIRNMRPIPRYEERTIYGEVEGKVGGSIVQLSARSPGMHPTPSLWPVDQTLMR